MPKAQSSPSNNLKEQVKNLLVLVEVNGQKIENPDLAYKDSLSYPDAAPLILNLILDTIQESFDPIWKEFDEYTKAKITAMLEGLKS